jgi:general secretion pathway protein M
MMQLIPDAKNAKLTAVLLLVVVLILVYLVAFHWFVLKHREYAEQVSTQREQLARFEAVVSQRGAKEQLLRDIRSGRQDENLFLGEADFNEAAAGLSNRLGQMVETLADESCQIVSRQPVRPRVQERYQRVTVNVRMRCSADDLLQILHRLESESPMVLVDDLNIIRQRARRRRNDAPETPDALDIRFNMSAYLAAS